MDREKSFIITRIRRKLAKLISHQTQIETYFNLPFKFLNISTYWVNERIVEVPFIFTELKAEDKKFKILDFGCTDSWLSLSMASLGHDVYGIDLRDYPFKHKNLVFKKQNLLGLEETEFDVIIALSSLEHVGLKAYGAEYEPDALDKIISKLYKILAAKGRLILTVPVGEPLEDNFLKSFAPEEIVNLMVSHGFFLEKSRYFQRINNNQWLPCSQEKIKKVSNRFDQKKKKRHGVNGIGCFVFSK